ncbi:hypothetical protein RclHR1_04000002 [Rhizophagus clarus]|uniref:Uncharacterized protein n=1 Tax=Rhizophagus clarus TaxID=94130 RepID=A0A2Z6RG69_9GLOM|nr:hypothetical protein RclHR1_04000002 [Rhizophagus clarus]
MGGKACGNSVRVHLYSYFTEAKSIFSHYFFLCEYKLLFVSLDVAILLESRFVESLVQEALFLSFWD